ncbi:hypothetical protein EKO27_g10737 [Xylaria grammica]|uniref:Uncharacterized protein n=1 Tax=Xylaria grammica TaxID=363999 RepID=A0A439CQD5_9PEZI|nr:hypothetical protein EKO27_g10737 [Xylaria grammica]
MCYPLTHLCRVCYTPVRADPNCRGLCYIQRVQTPFVIDEYCTLHEHMAGMEGYPIIDEEAAYAHILDTAGVGRMDDANKADAAYAENMAQYQVKMADEAAAAMNWLNAINEAPVQVNLAETWEPVWTPELEAELELINKQLERAAENEVCPGEWSVSFGETDNDDVVPLTDDEVSQIDKIILSDDDVSLIDKIASSGEIALSDDIILSEAASFDEIEGFNASGFDIGPIHTLYDSRRTKKTGKDRVDKSQRLEDLPGRSSLPALGKLPTDSDTSIGGRLGVLE